MDYKVKAEEEAAAKKKHAANAKDLLGVYLNNDDAKILQGAELRKAYALEFISDKVGSL